jgi:hypothetical protein
VEGSRSVFGYVKVGFAAKRENAVLAENWLGKSSCLALFNVTFVPSDKTISWCMPGGISRKFIAVGLKAFPPFMIRVCKPNRGYLYRCKIAMIEVGP